MTVRHVVLLRRSDNCCKSVALKIGAGQASGRRTDESRLETHTHHTRVQLLQTHYGVGDGIADTNIFDGRAVI